MANVAKTKAKESKLAKNPKKKSSQAILDRFAKVFNAALDERDVPRLHFGRHVAVSKMYNVSISAARKWVTGESLPDTDNLITIAKDLGYTLDMMIGEDSPEKKKIFVAIPVMKRNSDDASKLKRQKTKMIHIDDAMLDDSMRMKFNNIEIFVVEDDDMVPAIHPGDYAFVDTAITGLEDQRTYIFETSDSRILIRKVNFGLNGDYLLSCADRRNQIEITAHQSDLSFGKWPSDGPKTTLRVIGQIPWVFKRLTKRSI